MNNQPKKRYIQSINKVIDFIQDNLNGELSLEILSQVSGFSPFHFHRIFKAFVGETLNNFTKRIRVEKAASFLVSDPDLSITQIAFRCGYSSSQVFARSFNERFDTSPSEYRKKYSMESSNFCNIRSKKEQAFHIGLDYSGEDSRPTIHYKSNSRLNMKVEVKNLPDVTVAYVRHIGPYKGNSKLFEDLFNRLMAWAGPRNLLDKDTKMYCVYHDDPKTTDEAKLRTDVCMSVPKDAEVEGEIGKYILKGGKYALARFEIKEPSEYEEAWMQVYNDWLPESGYIPDDRPAFEWYQGDPKEHPDGKHIVDICVPIKVG